MELHAYLKTTDEDGVGTNSVWVVLNWLAGIMRIGRWVTDQDGDAQRVGSISSQTNKKDSHEYVSLRGWDW